MPGAVPHTSTWALTNTTISYAVKVADAGLVAAARTDPALRLGLNTYRGHVTYEPVAAAHRLEFVSVQKLLA
jgi:alanine dehydrogenase